MFETQVYLSCRKAWMIVDWLILLNCGAQTVCRIALLGKRHRIVRISL